MRRQSVVGITLVLIAAAAGLSATQPAIAQSAGNPPSTGTTMPSDIGPKSGFRLPLPKREDLDEAGQKAFDRGNTPGGTIAGLQGPAGIQLFSPKTAANVSALNRYLRFEAGFTPHVREVAILTTAREMDSQVRMGRARARGAGEGVPQSTSTSSNTAQHRRRRPDRRAHHRARPPAVARPQVNRGLCAAENSLRAEQARQLVMLMGNYAGTAALLTAVDMQLHTGKAAATDPLRPKHRCLPACPFSATVPT